MVTKTSKDRISMEKRSTDAPQDFGENAVDLKINKEENMREDGVAVAGPHLPEADGTPGARTTTLLVTDNKRQEIVHIPFGGNKSTMKSMEEDRVDRMDHTTKRKRTSTAGQKGGFTFQIAGTGSRTGPRAAAQQSSGNLLFRNYNGQGLHRTMDDIVKGAKMVRNQPRWADVEEEDDGIVKEKVMAYPQENLSNNLGAVGLEEDGLEGQEGGNGDRTSRDADRESGQGEDAVDEADAGGLTMKMLKADGTEMVPDQGRQGHGGGDGGHTERDRKGNVDGKGPSMERLKKMMEANTEMMAKTKNVCCAKSRKSRTGRRWR